MSLKATTPKVGGYLRGVFDVFGWGVNTISGNFLLLCEENIYRRHILCFQLTFFDFPAAKNFEEFLGADLSISETSSLPEAKQTYFGS